jgi:hypothetical protein
MITNTGREISAPNKNKVVFFKPWQGKDARKKAYPVIINDGQFLSNGRISNFWDWQRVNPTTGKINSKAENGYGNFTVATGFSISINENSIVSAEGTKREVKREIVVL